MEEITWQEGSIEGSMLAGNAFGSSSWCFFGKSHSISPQLEASIRFNPTVAMVTYYCGFIIGLPPSDGPMVILTITEHGDSGHH